MIVNVTFTHSSITVAARKPYRILSHLTGIGSCATRMLNPPSLGTISKPIPNIKLSMTLLSPTPLPHRAPGFQRHRHPWKHRVLLFSCIDNTPGSTNSVIFPDAENTLSSRNHGDWHDACNIELPETQVAGMTR